jgi:hypothetical protein
MLVISFLLLTGYGISLEVLEVSEPPKDALLKHDQRLYMAKLMDDPVPTARS